ncbi:MAG: VanW family protein [Oscillospiraceae bacterium]|nr:VanW family protein [Oscillospiraceae bacterium]
MKRLFQIYISLIIFFSLFCACAFAAPAAQVISDYHENTLARTSTPLLSDIPNRTGNIVLACGMINKTVLMPGDIFSFNQIVGNRTEARGFKAAPTFVNGRVEDSVGGGICQVSSTLYYACLLSNLEIVYRAAHSMCPDYIESPGLDATVSWGSLDYKFKNNTDNPIKIFARVEDNEVYVEISGTKADNNTVVIESEILSITPFQTIYRDNPGLGPGEEKVVQPPFTGYVSETYRVIMSEDGNIISRTLETKNTYRKLDKIIERNPLEHQPAFSPKILS